MMTPSGFSEVVSEWRSSKLKNIIRVSPIIVLFNKFIFQVSIIYIYIYNIHTIEPQKQLQQGYIHYPPKKEINKYATVYVVSGLHLINLKTDFTDDNKRGTNMQKWRYSNCYYNVAKESIVQDRCVTYKYDKWVDLAMLICAWQKL